MKKNNLRSAFLLLSLILVAAVSVGAAFAYFTDYDQLMGSAKLALSNKSEVEENVQGTRKTISIKNTGTEGKNSSCVAKVLIYGPEGMTVTPDKAEDWTKLDTEDGVFEYYYNGVLAPGESTSNIVADVANVPESADMADFEVIVLQESETFAVDDDGYVVAPDGWTDFPRIQA